MSASPWSWVTNTNVMPTLLLDLLELDLHLLAELAVERAERLVEQEDAGPVDERTRERDPLALAAGELARLAVPEAVEPHDVERLVDALPRVRRLATFLTRSPYSTFCATVMCGNSA